MPIDIDQFVAGDEHRDPTTSERVVRFLLVHDDLAFTRREIADAIEVAPETVGTNLTRLKRRGLVRHREPYWAITEDRERVASALGEGDDSSGEVDGTHSAPPGTDTTAEDEPPDTWSHREAAAAFFDRVRDAVGEDVDSLYLFGSVAVGTESLDSDVDVLAVVAEDADFAGVDDQLLGISYDAQLEYDVTIEVHPIGAGEFEARKERGEPFVRSVVEESVIGG